MRSVPLVTGCMLPDKTCHDPFGPCFWSLHFQQAVCVWNWCCSGGKNKEWQLIPLAPCSVRPGHLAVQGMLPCLRFWKCGKEKGKVFILSSWKTSLAIFLGENKQMDFSGTLRNLFAYLSRQDMLTKKKGSPASEGKWSCASLKPGHWDSCLTSCPTLGLQCFFHFSWGVTVTCPG